MKNRKKKVSIIVPVYNVEQYLRRCLDSLVHQTMEEIEILLVDDASTDDSPEIMAEYEKAYPDKIMCIYQKVNQRQGAARNKGLEYASGDYIMYVDSDDYLPENACELLYAEAIRGDFDMVCGSYYTFYQEDGKRVLCMAPLETITSKEQWNKKAKALSANVWASWRALVRRRLITDNNITFAEHKFYEDAAAVPLFYLYANSISFISAPVYVYCIQRKGQTTGLPGNETFKDRLEVLEILWERTREFHRYEAVRLALEQGSISRITGACYGWIKQQPFPEIISEVGTIYNDFKSRYPNCKGNPFYYFEMNAKFRAFYNYRFWGGYYSQGNSELLRELWIFGLLYGQAKGDSGVVAVIAFGWEAGGDMGSRKNGRRLFNCL